MKKASVDWTVGKLMAIVLAIVFLAIIAYGWVNNGFGPLSDRAYALVNNVKASFVDLFSDEDTPSTCYNIDIVWKEGEDPVNGDWCISPSLCTFNTSEGAGLGDLQGFTFSINGEGSLAGEYDSYKTLSSPELFAEAIGLGSSGEVEIPSELYSGVDVQKIVEYNEEYLYLQEAFEKSVGDDNVSYTDGIYFAFEGEPYVYYRNIEGDWYLASYFDLNYVPDSEQEYYESLRTFSPLEYSDTEMLEKIYDISKNFLNDRIVYWGVSYWSVGDSNKREISFKDSYVPNMEGDVGEIDSTTDFNTLKTFFYGLVGRTVFEGRSYPLSNLPSGIESSVVEYPSGVSRLALVDGEKNYALVVSIDRDNVEEAYGVTAVDSNDFLLLSSDGNSWSEVSVPRKVVSNEGESTIKLSAIYQFLKKKC